MNTNIRKISRSDATKSTKFRGQRAKQGTAVGHAPRIGRVCGVNSGPVSARAVGV